MNSSIKSIVTVAGILFAGCASSPPKELVDARAAYNRAASGPAAEVNPAQLHVAKQTLVLAEQTFDDEGSSYRARDRAYVAMRKAQLAEVQARILEADKESAQLRQQAEMSENRMIANARNEASKAKEELAGERARREESDRRAREALEKLGKVMEDERGMVVSLSGQLLFPNARATLTPPARQKLTQVAEVLAKGDPSTAIIIEGHTDSKGSAKFNDSLSKKRADSVRLFLIGHGVAKDRITSEGYGFSRPIADNSTPEGRAENRRVEIVVQDPTKMQKKQPGTQNPPTMGPSGEHH